ncbi:hypothetical protein [Streptomyces sp. NPDC058155]|uniref:hypothetical protein n=1 Tax=Streptomyces sp. NPDC058155 TaxID=3346359 RepID=UPI0036E05469
MKAARHAEKVGHPPAELGPAPVDRPRPVVQPRVRRRDWVDRRLTSSTARTTALVSGGLLVLGFLLFDVNHEAGYCARHPGAGPNKRVSQPCYAIETAWYSVPLVNAGLALLLLGVVGLVVSFFVHLKYLSQSSG